MCIPSSVLSSIKQPSSPNVTITNFTFDNLNIMETSAVGIEGALVHACRDNKHIIVFIS